MAQESVIFISVFRIIPSGRVRQEEHGATVYDGKNTLQNGWNTPTGLGFPMNEFAIDPESHQECQPITIGHDTRDQGGIVAA